MELSHKDFGLLKVLMQATFSIENERLLAALEATAMGSAKVSAIKACQQNIFLMYQHPNFPKSNIPVFQHSNSV
jgi:hypothetical protein